MTHEDKPISHTRGISVMLRTIDFRGDHAADAFVVYDVDPNISVRDLVDRLIGHRSYIDPEYEVIEIRVKAIG